MTLIVDLDQFIGEGSMRKACKAEVKTIEKDGSEKIIDFVAKIQFGNDFPHVSNHAANARTYRATTLLLNKYKEVVLQNQVLRQSYCKKAALMEVSTSIFSKLYVIKSLLILFLFYFFKGCSTCGGYYWSRRGLSPQSLLS
jgi:hypothetical protein